MEGLQDSNSVHLYPETRLKSVESSSSNPVGPSCPTTMQSRPDSCNNGQGHRINFVKWPITTMPPLARACSLLTFSPRCRSGAAPMPISHLSGRARYTINLEASALCLKLLGENFREMQVIPTKFGSVLKFARHLPMRTLDVLFVTIYRDRQKGVAVC